jgi:drug/metabolite transporter (DMT)-like permease
LEKDGPVSDRKADSAAIGVVYILSAVFCFSLIDTITQYVVMFVPTFMALFVRYMLQTIMTSSILLPIHGRRLLRTNKLSLQILRGILIIISTTLAFKSLKVVPVGEFTAILMMTPMLVTFLAVFFLGEQPRKSSWLFVAGGFIGMLFIVRPGGEAGGLGWDALWPIGCLMSSALFQLLSSYLGRSEKPVTTHFYSTIVGMIGACLIVPSSWTLVEDLYLWGLMTVMGIMGALGHFLLSLAYQKAPATTLMPYVYCQVGFSVLGGWIGFQHVPDHWALIGIGLIALSGLANALEMMRHKQQSLQ